MAHLLLQPLPPVVCCFRASRAPRAASPCNAPATPLRASCAPHAAPWQTMLAQARHSSPLELSTSGRSSDSLLSQLYTVGCTTEQDHRRNQQQEYFLNYGRALRILREDIPRFFKQAPDASIFTEDVLFLDHIGPRIGLISASVAGRKAYSQRIWLLRTHSRLIFSRCEIEVLRMWERDSRTLAVRWKLRCFPHLLTGKLVNLDGISEYKFNDSGLIYQHTVDTIDLDSSRKREQRMQLQGSPSMVAC